MQFTVRPITRQLADEVRRTRLSPGYGHPAHLEMARGTGPCRCCLQPFVAGRDARLLFTYRPAGHDDSLLAPGPVFIHAEQCQAYAAPGFPDGLRSLPLAFEARASGSRVIELATSRESSPEEHIERLFETTAAEWIQLRNAEAGCFIARVDRA